MRRYGVTTLLGLGMMIPEAPAEARTVEDLQRQIDELKAVVRTLSAEQRRRKSGGPTPSPRPAAPRPVETAGPASGPASGTAPVLSGQAQPAPAPPAHAGRPKTWFERLTLRGYTQLRVNEVLAGDADAPAGSSRLRSVHDGGIRDRDTFTFRRVRLILQGDVHERVAIYLQPDFAVSVGNQSAGEPRGGFAQLRDAYADVFLDDERRTRLRFGQQKVPYGWENLQSSQNRLTLDRSDAINSAIPGERDIGITAYHTPPSVQRIWDRLGKDGQKLFGNYGAFGVGVYNGQTINRLEQNDDVMIVGMATWPFALDGLGSAFAGQVLEVGGSAYRNRFKPEIRAGGVSPVSYADERVGVHAILYPQPFGLQAEWNWGRGPEFDALTRAIETKPLEGGYLQAMYRFEHSLVGPFMPYARLQTYRGGWKVATNAPPLATDEFEVGIEFQPIKPLEITLAYSKMRRREADERRFGRARGDLFRAQVQWNY
ncbi:porin (plasmid) [Methylobacterium sp. NMS12]|uniref:porin n=1 Tax=Methylobacterium sp. NMS12 TaxID=3079766 RepID=UPI003F8822E9